MKAGSSITIFDILPPFKGTSRRNVCSNIKTNTDTVLIRDDTTHESHSDQLVGKQYITDGLVGECFVHVPQLSIKDPKTGKASTHFATLGNFGTLKISTCEIGWSPS